MTETTDKSLKSRAISIKWKDYVLVSDRVLYFNETYPNWSIQTELITEPQDQIVCIKSTITPNIENPWRYFTWYAQEKRGEGYINKTSAIENAETSAVGRALAMMWIWVIDSIASVDEINKANNRVVKPWFNEKEYTDFCKVYLNYGNWEEAIKKITSKYNISDIMKNKVLSLYVK